MKKSEAFSIGPVKQFFNLFRRLFTIRFLENFLLRQIKHGRHPLWKKLAPPGYLYQKKTIRRTKINGIRFLPDINNVVEHPVLDRIK